jgi:hypothetical protein
MHGIRRGQAPAPVAKFLADSRLLKPGFGFALPEGAVFLHALTFTGLEAIFRPQISAYV